MPELLAASIAPRPRPGSAIAASSRRAIAGIAAALLVALVFLAIGSVHKSVPSAQSRIDYLESVIKCPSCEDLSIGQSTSSTAQGLDVLVVRDVRAGMSNQAIESVVLASYPGSILIPQGGLGALAIGLPIALIVIAASGLGYVLWRRRSAAPVPILADDETLVQIALLERQGSDDRA